LEYAHGAKTLGVVRTIDVPKTTAVLFAHVDWNSTKSVCFEFSIPGVGRHDIANLEDGLFVLVHFTGLADLVETAVVRNFQVGKREVNCNTHI
jgi:hypothetical protein